MIKNVLKEILVTIILVATVLLMLSIILYDYNPIVKTIPESVAYEIDEELSKEINTEVIPNDTKVIITYEVDNKDLSNSQDYNPGKKNPFIKYSTQTSGNSNGGFTGNNTNNSQSNTIGGNSSNGTSGSNSGYFPNTSTK